MGVLEKVTGGRVGSMTADELRDACTAKRAELDTFRVGGDFRDEVHEQIDEAVAESGGYVERRLREEVATRGTAGHREIEPAEAAILAVAAGGSDRLAASWKRVADETLTYESGSRAERFARRAELEGELAALLQAWQAAAGDGHQLERDRAAEFDREQQRLAATRDPNWRPPA